MTLDDFKTILTEFEASQSPRMNLWRRNGYHSVLCRHHETLSIKGDNLLVVPKDAPEKRLYTAISEIECVSF
ncbi:hypothetical protein E3E12_01670 [Formicincola oecophyllae]|uniref:Uncharacterized protein n=1 Tax=Formicincola oecophyllae TaxID=2558361 RepID=A0A4Y6U981_9PROT|nr:hypothetical protein [Formicincola oecophyllae]QDH13118.1 hypothetical protein E3E12_01670 [Formicincola oecophyllae]